MAQRVLGLILPPSVNITAGLQLVSRFGADVCVVYLADDNFYYNGNLETLRTGDEWASKVCGHVTRSWSRENLPRITFELSMAAHFGLPGVIVPLPKATGADLTAIADILLSHCNANGSTKIIINVGAGDEDDWLAYRALLEELNIDPFSISSLGNAKARWQTYSSLRNNRGAHGMINALVSATANDTPNRWFGERLSGFALPSDTQVLWHSKSVVRLLQARCSPMIDLRGELPHTLLGVEVLDRVGRELGLINEHFFSFKDSIGAPFEDMLQLPLQPLGDHLPNPTYSVFEGDEIKYTVYQMSVEAYLREHHCVATDSKSGIRVVVLGAGRGPIVTSILKAQAASQTCGRHLHITIVEKNPHAAQYLRVRLQEDPLWVEALAEGTASFEIVEGDGRVVGASLGRREHSPSDPMTWPVQLVVSELLGGFSDNELSPECIEGFMASYLGSSHEGRQRPVCIPSEYSSVAAPVYSSVLLERVRDLCLKGGVIGHDDPMAVFHQMYVVEAVRHTLLAPPKKIFTFDHRGASTAQPLERTQTVMFQATSDGVLHGFLGYFECVLYKEDLEFEEAKGSGMALGIPHPCLLSTNPVTRTEGMHSWFPMFIPLLPQHREDGSGNESLLVHSGDMVSLHITRKTDDNGVWYEWRAFVGASAESLQMNPNGSFSKIRL